MSLILDALRGGAPRTTPRPNSNAAQTDAVLQTLGYGRFSATSPLNSIKRLLGYLLVGILFAIRNGVKSPEPFFSSRRTRNELRPLVCGFWIKKTQTDCHLRE